MDATLAGIVRTADWRNEKHVPVLVAPASAKAGEAISVEIAVGRGIPHPNTVEHHIAWLALHFVPDGAATSVELARVEVGAHGQAATPGEGPARTAPSAVVRVQLARSGAFHATSYCNIHGLWTSSAHIAVE